MQWTDESVVERWLLLNPRKNESAAKKQSRIEALLEDQDRLAELRQRLGSLSWFMRYLNEPLARLANREDGCKGRFWEGRFQSQRLLDEQAILGAMVYVDLNPVRAGITPDVTQAAHTSLVKRARDKVDKTSTMTVMGKSMQKLPFAYTFDAYIQLVEWTLQAQQSIRPTRISGFPSLDKWIRQYLPTPGRWQRALGSIESLKQYAKDLGLCWIRTHSPRQIS